MDNRDNRWASIITTQSHFTRFSYSVKIRSAVILHECIRLAAIGHVICWRHWQITGSTGSRIAWLAALNLVHSRSLFEADVGCDLFENVSFVLIKETKRRRATAGGLWLVSWLLLLAVILFGYMFRLIASETGKQSPNWIEDGQLHQPKDSYNIDVRRTLEISCSLIIISLKCNCSFSIATCIMIQYLFHKMLRYAAAGANDSPEMLIIVELFLFWDWQFGTSLKIGCPKRPGIKRILFSVELLSIVRCFKRGVEWYQNVSTLNENEMRVQDVSTTETILNSAIAIVYYLLLMTL